MFILSENILHVCSHTSYFLLCIFFIYIYIYIKFTLTAIVFILQC